MTVPYGDDGDNDFRGMGRNNAERIRRGCLFVALLWIGAVTIAVILRVI